MGHRFFWSQRESGDVRRRIRDEEIWDRCLGRVQISTQRVLDLDI